MQHIQRVFVLVRFGPEVFILEDTIRNKHTLSMLLHIHN
jgi:hypothetical protein